MITREEELFLKNMVHRLSCGKTTKFLNQREYQLLIPLLKKDRIKYQIYTYCECNDTFFLYTDKVILYNDTFPSVCCFKIQTTKNLTHQDILGSIFSLSIDIHNFGDIIIDGNSYYILVLKELSSYIQANLCIIGNQYVVLEEVSVDEISNFKKKFTTFSIITSSLRLDSIVSKIAQLSRNKALDLLKDKKVLLNYSSSYSASTLLKENDIFSIHKIGKFYLSSVTGNTKSGKLIVEIKKYS